jgi:DNA-binding HxlR family transcriptional regulator
MVTTEARPDRPDITERGSAFEMTPENAPACDLWLARAFEVLGKRWNGVILGTLGGGPTGFAELRRGVGTITDSVLSERLASLTDAGLVVRAVTDSRPPGVNYALTPAGVALVPALEQLAAWAAANLPSDEPAHHSFEGGLR